MIRFYSLDNTSSASISHVANTVTADAVPMIIPALKKALIYCAHRIYKVYYTVWAPWNTLAQTIFL